MCAQAHVRHGENTFLQHGRSACRPHEHELEALRRTRHTRLIETWWETVDGPSCTKAIMWPRSAFTRDDYATTSRWLHRSSSRTQNRKSIGHDNSYVYRHRHPHLTSHTFPPSRRVVVVVVRPPSRRAVVVDGMRSGGRSGNVNRNQKRSLNAWPNHNRPQHTIV